MKHWVFDLDGTLVDSFGRYFSSLESIFSRHGKSFDQTLFHAALTEPFDQFLSSRLGAHALNDALRLFEEHSRADASEIRVFDGITDVLSILRSRGARIGVWTNRDLGSAELVLKATGLDRFAELCVSGTCVERKPSPAGLLRIAQAYGCEPRDVTVVGDHEHDVLTPKSLGARGVRASWHGYWQMADCAHADHQFHSVADFKAWVSSLASL